MRKVILLKKELGLRKWIALVMVASGVAIVQLAKTKIVSYRLFGYHHGEEGFLHLIGITIAIASCVTSGLAAVWFEMLLKTTSVDLWLMNVQVWLAYFLPSHTSFPY